MDPRPGAIDSDPGGAAMSAHQWLVLLRHAHAEAGLAGQPDEARTLSVLGETEADAAGDFLASSAGLPPFGRVICSPARRTRQTAERVLARLGAIDIHCDPRVYEASPGDLLDVLDDHAGEAAVLLVGHNPGLERLVALLCTGRSGGYRGMPPAGVAVLQVPGERPIEPGSAELVAFWSP